MFGNVHRALDANEWDLNVITSVLQEEASGVNEEDDEGRVPLRRVLRDEKCSADIVNLLLDYGARVLDSNVEFLLTNFIYFGACKNKAEVISVLVKRGACVIHDSMSVLCFAIQHNADDDIIKVLLDAGLLNRCIHHSFLPLICATENIDIPVRLSVFRLLIDAGAHPDVRSTNDGGSPLHKVLGNDTYDSDDMLDILELLIDRGARIAAEDNAGDIPLHTAVTYYETYPSSVECLLKKGSPVNKRNKAGLTPLDVAVTQHSNTDILELLFSAGSILGGRRHTALQNVMIENMWEVCMDSRLRTFFKYYFLEDSSSSEVEDLIVGHENYEDLSRFKSECLRELQKMEAKRVCRGRYSLLEFVKMFSREQVVDFNRKIMDCGIHLLKVLADNSLPLYFEVILFKVHWFFDRKLLEDQLLHVDLSTSCMGRKIILDYDCIGHLAQYLPEHDLLTFIYVFYSNDCLK